MAENEFLRYTRRQQPPRQEENEFLRYARREPTGGMNAFQAFGSGAADGLTFGFGDELMGVGGGIASAATGRGWDAGYAEASEASRARQAQAEREHGGAYIGGQFVGATLPFLGPGLAARGALALTGRAAIGNAARDAAMTAARKYALPGINAAERFAVGNGGSLARRVLGSAAIAAPYGFVAGMGHANDTDPVAALDDGFGGALMSAAAGAAFPAIFAGAGAIKEAIRPTRIAIGGAPSPVIEGAMGMSDASTPPMQVEQSALDKVLRLIGESRTSVDDLQNQITANTRYDPGRGRTMVDDIGVGAEKTMKYLNKSPGETAGLADEVFSPRNRDALSRIEAGLDDVIPAPDEMVDIPAGSGPIGADDMMRRRAAARQEFDRLRTDVYAKIWGQSVTPKQAQTANTILAQIADDPIVQSGARRANEIWTRPQVARAVEEISAGRQAPEIEPLASNPLRQLHYIKRGLDEEVAWRNRPLSQNPLTEEEEATVRALRGTLRRALDDLIPGYRDANAKWGDESAAVYAMDFGRRLLRGRFRPDLMEELSVMSPYERDYALVGIKQDILETLRSRDIEGRRNIADALLNTETQRRLRTVLGEDRAERLRYMLTTESRLHRTATNAGARSGSDTGIFGAELIDDVMRMQRPNGPIDAAWQMGQSMLNDVVSGVGQRRRDEIGRLLLQATDNPDEAERVRQLFAALRERERARQAAAQGYVSGGAAGGAAYTGTF